MPVGKASTSRRSGKRRGGRKKPKLDEEDQHEPTALDSIWAEFLEELPPPISDELPSSNGRAKRKKRKALPKLLLQMPEDAAVAYPAEGSFFSEAAWSRASVTDESFVQLWTRLHGRGGERGRATAAAAVEETGGEGERRGVKRKRGGNSGSDGTAVAVKRRRVITEADEDSDEEMTIADEALETSPATHPKTSKATNGTKKRTSGASEPRVPRQRRTVTPVTSAAVVESVAEAEEETTPKEVKKKFTAPITSPSLLPMSAPVTSPPQLRRSTSGTAVTAVTTAVSERHEVDLTKSSGVTPTQPTPPRKLRDGERWSSLTEGEHTTFLDLQRKRAIDNSRKPGQAEILTSNSRLMLHKLSEKVEKERKEYEEWMRATAVKTQREQYRIYEPTAKEQVEALLQAKRRQALAEVPARFEAMDARVDLVGMDCIPLASDPVLTHKATLLNTGLVPHCALPRLPISALVDDLLLVKDTGVGTGDDGEGDSVKVVEELSETVTEKEREERSVPKRRSRRLAREEKPEEKEEKGKGKGQATETQQESEAESKDLEAELKQKEKFTLGSASGKGQAWRKEVRPSVLKDVTVEALLQRHPCDVVASSSTFQALINNSPPFENSWTIPVRVQTVHPTKGEPFRVVLLGKPLPKEKLTLREKNEIFFKMALQRLCLSSHATNVTYNQWQFGPLRVMVRCSIAAFLPDRSSGPGFRYMGMRAKAEYHAHDEGLEVVSPSETARWWIYTFLRPDAHLLLGRFSVKDSQLLAVERKDMPRILAPGCSFKPENASKRLLVTLKALAKLEEGHYLLSHGGGENSLKLWREECVTATAEGEERTVRDIHSEILASGVSDEESVPFLMPQWQEVAGQIPYTFPVQKKAPATKKRAEKAAKSQAKKRQRVAAAKRKQKKIPGVRYCHEFSATGECSMDDRCAFPHMTYEEAKAAAAAQRGGPSGGRANLYQSSEDFVDWDSQGTSGGVGGAADFQAQLNLLRQSQEQRQKSARAADQLPPDLLHIAQQLNDDS